MQQRRRESHAGPDGRSLIAAVIGAVCVLLLGASCAHETVVDGRAMSMLYDPQRVGGLEAEGGPSGPRANAPAPTGTVEGTDNGGIDHLSLLAINDIEQFWTKNFSESLQGSFKPVTTLLSYDSNSPSAPSVCGLHTYKVVNAFFCPPDDTIAWDRGVLLAAAQKYFGDMAVAALLAHEYGHAVQRMAKLVDDSTPTVVKEQQADCFSGVYVRWVAEGNSPRFTVNTTDGLDHLIAGLIDIRDPVWTPDDADMIKNGHGTAVDRVGAFQIGFDSGASGCAGIDMNEITARRGNLPMTLQIESSGSLQTGEAPIDNETLSTLMEVLGKVFNPTSPPKLSTDVATCKDAQTSNPASYCPDSNTITVDLPSLQQMGKKANESQGVLVQGDNTAFSVVTSRYTLALQHERGMTLDSPQAALLTGCLTGVAQRKMADVIQVPSGKTLVLTAGDVDKAVAGLLTNGLAASDTNGKSVASGFTRILAYRSGLLGDTEQCYKRFS